LLAVPTVTRKLSVSFVRSFRAPLHNQQRNNKQQKQRVFFSFSRNETYLTIRPIGRIRRRFGMMVVLLPFPRMMNDVRYSVLYCLFHKSYCNLFCPKQVCLFGCCLLFIYFVSSYWNVLDVQYVVGTVEQEGRRRLENKGHQTVGNEFFLRRIS
jgi:hypothetical protein